MESAKGENCTLQQPGCRNNSDYVVGCHLNTIFKGTGLKSPDLFIVYGCDKCHAKLDAFQVSKADQLRALMITQMKLVEKGLITI